MEPDVIAPDIVIEEFPTPVPTSARLESNLCNVISGFDPDELAAEEDANPFAPAGLLW